MRRLFGKKKETPPPPTLGETSEKLAGRSSKLEQEQAELNKKINALVIEMKKPENKGRQATLKKQCFNLIKRRKLIESQMNLIEGQRFNLDVLAMNQETIQTNIDAVNAMKANVKQMQVQMKDISIEGVDDTMLDMEDMVAECNEISDALAGNITADYDEDELNAEFEAMTAEMDSPDFNLNGLGDTTLVTGPNSAPSALQTK